MKQIKLLLLASFFMASTVLSAQAVEKTFVRSFNILGSQEIVLQLEGAVEVKTWKQSIARVQMTIGLERGSESMLRSLAQAGRYNLKGSLTSDSYVVGVPGMEREVRVNGQILTESVSYVVFVPENVHVVIDNSTSAAAF